MNIPSVKQALSHFAHKFTFVFGIHLVWNLNGIKLF